MNKFKEFYNEKKGKYILFFGFYLIFFIFFAIYIRSLRANVPEEPKKEEEEVEKITTYNISNLINEDYHYTIEIVDNEEIINFQGTKNNIDYANFPNRYFLDIYNLNQLLKKSKLVNSEGSILTYELNNSEINDILLTDKSDGINKIMVYVNENGEVNKIDLDLSNYLEKDKYTISINYEIGDRNENSSS